MSVLRPGQRFRAYQLRSLISRGGMGEVWRATKQGPDGWAKDVALKVILPSFADQEHFVTMFLEEARIAARLEHPAIVPVTDFGREGELVWFEQELVQGLDARQLLAHTGALPVRIALHLTARLLEGLAYAHERSPAVVHRDVKPHNLLVAYEGHVKLTDFGIAKAMHTGGASQSELKGTAGYIAPEILSGQRVTPAADVFGAGLVLWELLTGRRLFDGDNEAVRIKRTLDGEVPPLARAGVAAPPEVDALLQRMLARDPADRLATAAAALAQLVAIPGVTAVTALEVKQFLKQSVPAPEPDQDAVPVPVDTEREPPRGSSAVTAPPPPKSNRRLVIMGVTAAVALGAALAVGLGRKTPQATPVPATHTEPVAAPQPQAPPVTEPVRPDPEPAAREPEPAPAEKPQPAAAVRHRPRPQAAAGSGSAVQPPPAVQPPEPEHKTPGKVGDPPPPADPDFRDDFRVKPPPGQK